MVREGFGQGHANGTRLVITAIKPMGLRTDDLLVGIVVGWLTCLVSVLARRVFLLNDGVCLTAHYVSDEL